MSQLAAAMTPVGGLRPDFLPGFQGPDEINGLLQHHANSENCYYLIVLIHRKGRTPCPHGAHSLGQTQCDHLQTQGRAVKALQCADTEAGC